MIRTSGLVVLSVVWSFFLALIGSPEAILFTVPVFLLAAPLAFERYVGEDILAAFRHRPAASRAIAAILAKVPAVVCNPVSEATLIPGRGPPSPAH
mgnify:CR=1 FL=1